MSLASQIIEKLKILLDKPISSFTTSEINHLLDKQILTAEVILPLFLSKSRADLLIRVVQVTIIPAALISNMLRSLKREIIRYSQSQVSEIWRIILQKKEYASYRQEWGVSEILRQAMKKTNEESKKRLLQLLSFNLQLLSKLQQIQIIQSFVKTFCPLYIKFNNYLPPYPTLALQCIQFSNQMASHPIDSATKIALFQHTLTLLQSSVNKLFYSFHNNCLKIISLLLNQEKAGTFDSLHLHRTSKIVDNFLWKKATRQQARKAQYAIQGAQLQLKQSEQGKMVYQFEKKQAESPLLIENVISRVNKYRQRQNNLSFHLKSSCSASKSFLKKGKTSLQEASPVKVKKNLELENMIDRCFEQSENRINQRQKRKPYQEINQKSSLSLNSNQNRKQEMRQVHIGRINVNREVEEGSSDIFSSRVEDLDEFAQISSLIDLAYQYKFS